MASDKLVRLIRDDGVGIRSELWVRPSAIVYIGAGDPEDRNAPDFNKSEIRVEGWGKSIYVKNSVTEVTENLFFEEREILRQRTRNIVAKVKQENPDLE